MEFIGFPKISRLSRECVVTEKIDGTNAQVFIKEHQPDEAPSVTPVVAVVGNLLIYAGSRTKWITPEDDNYGFAKWVRDNAEELATMGPGSHFGEWWGQGIQRSYGITEKRFSLFNVSRWAEARPSCCAVVPILFSGIFDSVSILKTMAELNLSGSIAAPGFDKPEGIVVFHKASNHLYKKTFVKDEEWKGKSK